MFNIVRVFVCDREENDVLEPSGKEQDGTGVYEPEVRAGYGE